MKMLKMFVSLIALTLISNCNAKPVVVITKYDNEIPKEIITIAEDLTKAIIKSVKDDKYNDFKSFTSDLLQENSKGQLQIFFSQIKPLISQNEFKQYHIYYSTNKLAKDDKSSNNIGSIIPSIGDKELPIINNFVFVGKKALNVFMRSTNDGMQYLMWMSFSKYKDDWKLNSLAGGDWGVEGLNAQKLIQKAMLYNKSDEFLSAVVYSIVTSKVLRPSSTLQYSDENEIINNQKQIQSEAGIKLSLPINIIKDCSVIGIDAVITKQGISPVLIYTTKTELNKDLLEKESKMILSEIENKFMDMRKNFDYVIFKAFNEAPIDPKKTYQNYSTVVNLKENK